MATKSLASKAINKLITKSNKQTKEDNTAFAKMSKEEARVHIAEDVLASLYTNRIMPRSGTWLESTSMKGTWSDDVKPKSEANAVFKKIKTCNACAVGGMFLCAIERNNNITVRKLLKLSKDDIEFDEEHNHTISDDEVVDDHDGEEMMTYLKRWFTYTQLKLIESAFELGEGGLSDGEGGGRFFSKKRDEDTDELIYHRDFEMDDAPRMRLIMENIIVNKGTFCPDKKPVKVDSKWITPGFLYPKEKKPKKKAKKKAKT